MYDKCFQRFTSLPRVHGINDVHCSLIVFLAYHQTSEPFRAPEESNPRDDRESFRGGRGRGGFRGRGGRGGNRGNYSGGSYGSGGFPRGGGQNQVRLENTIIK